MGNLESLRGGCFVKGTDDVDVKAFESAFELIVAALPVDQSRETLKKIMEGTPHGRARP